MNLDSHYMLKAIVLAKKATGFQLPNPRVGCVIVKNNLVIGQGFHEVDGSSHAEVRAIEDAVNNGHSVEGSTFYVTLTPCSQVGRTGSCAQLLIDHLVKKVVIASVDSSDKHAIELFKNNNILVIENVEKQEADKLNRPFFLNWYSNRPYVGIKIATTLDGFSATKNGDSKWITSEEMRDFSRLMRSQFQAIAIGVKTLEFDNPKLNVRKAGWKDPIVIIFAPLGLDCSKYELFKLGSLKKVFVGPTVITPRNIANTEFISMSSSIFSPKDILNELWKRNIKSILIEGGPKSQASFINEKIVDEINIFYGNKLLGDRSAMQGFSFQNVNKMSQSLNTKLVDFKIINNDIYTKWEVQ